MKKRSTIVDIAKEVGVTDGTVSRALANDPRVRPETRAKILEAAQKLNYHPHLSARLFKQGITKNIGVYSEAGSWIFAHHYYGRLVAGLAEAGQREDEHLVFYLPPKEECPLRTAQVKLGGLDALMDGRVDGAVVLGGDLIPSEDRAMLVASSLPVVFLSNNFEVPGFFQLVSGAYERTRDAAEYLFTQGHRRIGLSGYYQDAHYMQASLKGLGDFYESHHLSFNPDYVATPVESHFFDPGSIRARLENLRKAGVTAIISTEIVEALTGAELLKADGLSIPRDISLISFGPNLRGFAMNRPMLTTLETDLGGCGLKCFEMFKEARNGGVPRMETMKWELNPGGETVGPPSSGSR